MPPDGRALVASALISAVCFLGQSQALASELDYDETSRRVQAADLIALIEVNQIKRTQRDTAVLAAVRRLYKGSAPRGHLEIRHRGGSHVIDPAEPYFSPAETAIVFLQNLDPKRGYYRCLEGKSGKLTVRNENVYISADNPFLTVKIKKYEELLKRRL